MHRVLILSLIVLSLLVPASSALYIKEPDFYTGIASAGVKDVTNGLYGDVIFATDYGISVYTEDGTWYSLNPRHPGETAYGWLTPLDAMVSAIALDAEGCLWIGYPKGLQFGDEAGYQVIDDPVLLKNRNINSITRWGDEMWVATGRAGLLRYHDGNWTWYKPFGPEGLECYTVLSMAVDAASDALVIGSEKDGIQVLKNNSGVISFESVTYRGEPLRGISEVRVNPFGGVYLFNRTTVLQRTPDGEVVPVLDSGSLSAFPVYINDIAATPDGMLLVASTNGIYGWDGTNVTLHITSGDGIRSNAVKKLFIDAAERCWFVVPGNVGYIPLPAGLASLDLSAVSTQTTPEVPVTTAPPETPQETPAPEVTPGVTPGESQGALERVWASLGGRLGSVIGR